MKISNSYRYAKFVTLFVFIPLFSGQIVAQKLHEIKGTVRDAETREALPYCSVGIGNNTIGSITNEYGYFRILVPDSLAKAEVSITYLGYKEYKSHVNNLEGKNNKIDLIPANLEIREVIIRPMTPKDVIKKALKKIPDNYPSAPYIINGFFREQLTENQNYLHFIESFLKSYNHVAEDTSYCQVQLIQGRTSDDIVEFQFMRRELEKYDKRQARKAKRKGEEDYESIFDEMEIDLGGPYELMNPRPDISMFIEVDTNDLDNYKFVFEEDNIIGSKELYTISFRSRGKVENIRLEGKIYIEKKSYAIVKLYLEGEFLMPLVAKPILAALGIYIKDVEIKYENEYIEKNDIWYLKKNILQASGLLIKRRVIHENDYSTFYVDKAFVATSIQTENAEPFPEDVILPKNKPVIEQLGEYDEVFWQENNKIEFNIKE